MRVVDRKGVTLVETVVAAVILGITVGILLNSFVTGRVAAAMSRHHLQAAELARQKMEMLRELGYNNIVGNEQYPVTIDDGGTLNEDFNFNGVLDQLVDDEGAVIDKGEDINQNGVLDTRTNDDLLGTLSVTVNQVNLVPGCPDDLDDAWQARVEVQWTERIWLQDKVQTEFVETHIAKYSGL